MKEIQELNSEFKKMREEEERLLKKCVENAEVYAGYLWLPEVKEKAYFVRRVR